MTDLTNKRSDRLQCVQCGQVDAPRVAGAAPGWIAISLWVAATLLFGLPYLLGVAWPIWLAAAVFLVALVYTLWYFSRREKACRHCGGRQLEPVSGAGPG